MTANIGHRFNPFDSKAWATLWSSAKRVIVLNWPMIAAGLLAIATLSTFIASVGAAGGRVQPYAAACSIALFAFASYLFLTSAFAWKLWYRVKVATPIIVLVALVSAAAYAYLRMEASVPNHQTLAAPASASTASSGWDVLIWVLGAVYPIVPAVALILFIIWLFDTMYYYNKYRRPYLLALMDRKYPPSESIDLIDRGAAISTNLQAAINQATRDAARLVMPPANRWKDNREYFNAMIVWFNEHLKILEKRFTRNDSDVVRGLVFWVDAKADTLNPCAGQDSASTPPLVLSKSIGGRAIAGSSGDLTIVANVANVLMDQNYQQHSATQLCVSMLCVPVFCFQDGAPNEIATLVLSIESSVEGAYDQPYVEAGKLIGKCFGLVCQRWLDLVAASRGTAAGSS